MNIHETLIPVLQEIQFAKRYSELCKNYSDFNKSLNNYDKDFVRRFFEGKGVKVSYNKNENFYKILERVGTLKIQFNILPRSGFVQFVWDVKKEGERLPLGLGMWESIARELAGVDAKKPLFTSMEDLASILKEVFSIYSDFKVSLLKMERCQV